MAFFSPVSSQQFLAPPPLPSPAVSDQLAALSTDEPLPEAYHVDRIRLLTQSPRKLHLYWEFASNPTEALRLAFGAQAARYALVVRLITIETDVISWHEASPTRSQWFDVQPDKSYRAEVGFFAQGRAFIRLLSANVTCTPRAGVARTTAEADEFNVSPAEFARVLDEAGYTSDALEVSLEAADLETQDTATRTIAERLGGVPMSQISAEDLWELRSLLSALVWGMNPDALSNQLSPALAAWLAQVGRENNEALRTENLLEILRTTLGIQTTEIMFDELDEEATQRVARFVVGASVVNMPRQPFHIWMPSMTAGRIKRMNAERGTMN